MPGPVQGTQMSNAVFEGCKCSVDRKGKVSPASIVCQDKTGDLAYMKCK